MVRRALTTLVWAVAVLTFARHSSPALAVSCHITTHAHDNIGAGGVIEHVDDHEDADAGVFSCHCDESSDVPAAHTRGWGGSTFAVFSVYKSHGGEFWLLDFNRPRHTWKTIRTGTGQFKVNGLTGQTVALRVRIRASGTVTNPDAPNDISPPIGELPSQGMYVDADFEVTSKVDVALTQNGQTSDLFHGIATLRGPHADAPGLTATGDFANVFALTTSAMRNTAVITSDVLSTNVVLVNTNQPIQMLFDLESTEGAANETILPAACATGIVGGAADFVVELELVNQSGTFTLAPIAERVMEWSTINSGGAILAGGGVYTLAGGIGEFAAGPLLGGGAFGLLGGFWAFPGPPRAAPGRAPFTFSVTADSPTVTDFVAWEHQPDDLMVPGPVDDAGGEDVGGMGPSVSLLGGLIRGDSPPLDVDGISSNHGSFNLVAPNAYRIVFSVDRASIGVVGSCVNDQHNLNQQSADLFISTDFFRPVLPDGREVIGAANSNDCLINQNAADLIHTLPPDVAAPAAFDERDDLDGFDFQTFDADGDGTLDIPLYFSLKSAGAASADIFYLPAGSPETGPDGPIALYAFHGALGLTSIDDIDGLVVFDADSDGVFSNGDAVLLSLRPGSPSMNAGGNYHFGGMGHPADVFLVFKDAAGDTWISRFATYEELGFLVDASEGNLDALEVVIAEPPPGGDGDGDCDVDLGDAALFADPCLFGPNVIHPAGCAPFDFDVDGDVDLGDVAGFQRAFTGG